MEIIKDITNNRPVYNTRKATVDDGRSIYELLEPYAKVGVVLPRSETEIFEGLRDFNVYEAQGIGDKNRTEIIGVSATHIWQKDLIEIRSLVVKAGFERQGIGTALVHACLDEAVSLGAKQVFALTYGVDFFKSCGFKVIHKDTLPEKIWGDCMACAKFSDCDETAMVIRLKV